MFEEESLRLLEDKRSRLEVVLKFLEEGKSLVERDPIQASEKLYKAAEETIKTLALHFELKDVLEMVRGRGRWTVTDLENSVRRISKILGEEIVDAWDAANHLHVWGSEAKLEAEDVEIRLPRIENLVRRAQIILEETTQAQREA